MSLPRIDKLLEARAWLWAGAPAAAKGHDAPDAVRTLIGLIEALPDVLPVYSHATPEHKEQRQREDADEEASGPVRLLDPDLRALAESFARHYGARSDHDAGRLAVELLRRCP